MPCLDRDRKGNSHRTIHLGRLGNPKLSIAVKTSGFAITRDRFAEWDPDGLLKFRWLWGGSILPEGCLFTVRFVISKWLTSPTFPIISSGSASGRLWCDTTGVGFSLFCDSTLRCCRRSFMRCLLFTTFPLFTRLGHEFHARSRI